MHGSELFHQVDAVAVHAVVIRGREERDEIKPESSRVANRENEMIGGRSLHRSGLEGEGVLLPRSGNGRDGGGCEGLSSFVADHADVIGPRSAESAFA